MDAMKKIFHLNYRHFIIIFLFIAVTSVLLFIPPVSQKITYPHFADGRIIFGIPNAVMTAWFGSVYQCPSLL